MKNFFTNAVPTVMASYEVLKLSAITVGTIFLR